MWRKLKRHACPLAVRDGSLTKTTAQAVRRCGAGGFARASTNTHLVNTFVIFGSKTGDPGAVTPFSYCGLRLFGFKIYEGDTLVRDLVPCITKIGDAMVAGLYDAAHPELGDASFYANQGTGDFIFIRNAMDFFVTPAGAGTMDGSSWSNAFAGLASISGAIRSGDRIHCAVGTYPLTNQISIVNFASLDLRGGYAGTDDTDPYAKAATGETLITPAEGVATRLVYGKSSNIRMHDLVLAKGTFTGVAHASGLGAYLDTCTTLVSNCVFDSNSVIGQPLYIYMDAPKGGGIYASGGTLEVVDCLVTNCVLTKSQDNCRSFGGGIYAITTDVTVRRTTFIGNLIGNAAQNSFGSAIYLEGANAVIDECLFTSNRTYSGRASGGSAVYATGVSSLDISDSHFFGNAARGKSAFGGTLALVGSETTTTTRLDRCVFRGNGYDPSIASFNSGSIGMNGGRLEMSHCLVAELNVREPADSRNRSGDYKRSIDIALGTLLLDACTIAGNDGYGIYRDITYGVVGIQNSIIYSNTLGNVNIDTATYSCMEGEVTGEGVFAHDPLLSDDGYYHPRSAAGRLADGYFAGTSWVTDAVTSPTIDAGPVNGEWYKEPQPNNLRVNIGYDANTAAASKSATGDYVAFDGIAVVPLPPTNVTATSAYPMGIVGEVGGDGTIPATVTLVWDSRQGHQRPRRLGAQRSARHLCQVGYSLHADHRHRGREPLLPFLRRKHDGFLLVRSLPLRHTGDACRDRCGRLPYPAPFGSGLDHPDGQRQRRLHGHGHLLAHGRSADDLVGVCLGDSRGRDHPHPPDGSRLGVRLRVPSRGREPGRQGNLRRLLHDGSR